MSFAARKSSHLHIAVMSVLACAAAHHPVFAQDEQYGPVLEPGAEVSMPVQTEAVPAAIPVPLAQAAARALEQSPIVLVGLAEIAALEADLRTARWQRYPNLTAELLAATGGSNVADRDGLAVNLALEQPIWAGGAINSQVDAARFNVDVGRGALREARFNILFAVIQSYYDALLAFERAKVLEVGLAEHRVLIASIERRVRQEVSPLADLTLARSRLTQLEVELTTAREIGQNAMLRLSEFVGAEVERPVFSDEVDGVNVPVQPVAMTEMMSCSPTLERLRSEISVAEAQASSARRSLFPQLLFQLSQNEITGARAAIVLRAQTGNGLARLSAADSAEARVDQAVAELGQADREGRTRIGAEYITLRSSQQRSESGAQASQAASDLVASYRRQFVAGRRSWLDVLNAAREVTSARAAESDARVNAAASATRILALSCRWRPLGV